MALAALFPGGYLPLAWLWAGLGALILAATKTRRPRKVRARSAKADHRLGCCVVITLSAWSADVELSMARSLGSRVGGTVHRAETVTA